MNKEKSPLISVVMVNYNGLGYIKKTVPKILELNYPNFEFIVVDNGSKDGSIEYIKSLSRVKLVKSPRLREKNFACNYAIEKAKGEYIFLCDNDLLVKDKGLLEKLLKKYLKNKNIGLINIAYFNTGEKVTKGYGNYLYPPLFLNNKKEIHLKLVKKFDEVEISYPSGIGLFFHKNFWSEVGGYDDFLAFGGDDNDLGIKSWLYGYRNILYSKSLQEHIGMPERQDNKKYATKFRDMFYANLYTIIKNYSFLNMLFHIFLKIMVGFFKSIKQSLKRLHFGPLFAFFQGIYLLLKNLPVAFAKRRKVQYERVVKKDIFLNIKAPKV